MLLFDLNISGQLLPVASQGRSCRTIVVIVVRDMAVVTTILGQASICTREGTSGRKTLIWMGWARGSARQDFGTWEAEWRCRCISRRRLQLREDIHWSQHGKTVEQGDVIETFWNDVHIYVHIHIRPFSSLTVKSSNSFLCKGPLIWNRIPFTIQQNKT